MKRGLVLGCLLAGAAPVALAQGTATPTNPVGTTIPGIGTPAPGTAGQPALGLRDRPQLRLVPGITGVTGGSVLSQPGTPRFQYYVLNAITVGFRGLGQQGEVRIRLDALPSQDETGGCATSCAPSPRPTARRRIRRASSAIVSPRACAAPAAAPTCWTPATRGPACSARPA